MSETQKVWLVERDGRFVGLYESLEQALKRATERAAITITRIQGEMDFRGKSQTNIGGTRTEYAWRIRQVEVA